MAMRTTVYNVKDILDNTALSYSDVKAYIESANVFVTANLSGESLSTALMAEIERWIAAHFITITRERMVTEAEAGGAKAIYMGKYGEGLASTPYGQTAISLDTSSTLRAISEGKKNASSTAVESFDD